MTDPKGPNQSLRDVKIHVWKWSCALTSRLGAVLGRKGDDHDRGVRPSVLATHQSSKTKALTKAYSLILDNLDDSHDLTFEMIQRACVRKLRRSHARGVDRSPERRPATPHGAYKDKDLRRPKDFSRAKPDDVSAFLVNFLAQRGIKARTVLKDNDLPPDTLYDAFALKAFVRGRCALHA